MALNKVIMIGRLTKDPELRYTPNGVAVCQFTLAVDRPFANQNGERGADFIPMVAWKKVAENCANYLKKGSQVAVDGRIQTRNYENNEGRKVYVTEVIAESVQFLTPATQNGQHAGNGSGGQQSGNRNGGNSEPFYDDGQPIDISDDDLPF